MKKILIIPNRAKDKDYKYTKELFDILDGKAHIVMPESDEKSGLNAEFKGNGLYDGVDTVIILGGDGTMLQAAEPCGKRGIAVMGINLGKVGFMTEVETEYMSWACDKLLSDDFEIEKRMMMEISVEEKSGKTQNFLALNDAVIAKPSAEMILVELSANGEKVSEYISDGLIISTPTGSTGYSLSAGGPVADPQMELFIATPICAHMLSARPMLLSAEKTINVSLADGGDETATVTVDGEDKCVIKKGDKVTVRRSEYTFKIIKLGRQSFYYTMMAKL
ncbi:MAG: NAD(+)/NADH kinase [Clostridia bacterium]|nr:NAD(+)/NADH kinase [Clostridia bacterium]